MIPGILPVKCYNGLLCACEILHILIVHKKYQQNAYSQGRRSISACLKDRNSTECSAYMWVVVGTPYLININIILINKINRW